MRPREVVRGLAGLDVSNQITLSRHYALGTNASKNYYYNARGVFPRLDDGRLIRRRASTGASGRQETTGAGIPRGAAPRAPAEPDGCVSEQLVICEG